MVTTNDSRVLYGVRVNGHYIAVRVNGHYIAVERDDDGNFVIVCESPLQNGAIASSRHTLSPTIAKKIADAIHAELAADAARAEKAIPER